jgi:hypothetical protein
MRSLLLLVVIYLYILYYNPSSGSLRASISLAGYSSNLISFGLTVLYYF